jgi:hypothetical protein
MYACSSSITALSGLQRRFAEEATFELRHARERRRRLLVRGGKLPTARHQSSRRAGAHGFETLQMVPTIRWRRDRRPGVTRGAAASPLDDNEITRSFAMKSSPKAAVENRSLQRGRDD